MIEPTFVITESQRSAIAEYLSHRPWREVNALIAMVSQLPPPPKPASKSLKGEEAQ